MNDDSDQWETVVQSQGVTLDAPEIGRAIDLATERLRAIPTEEKDPDLTRTPPKPTDEMFPGFLKGVVEHCCAHSEAVPVAVTINVLLRFAALVGPLVYLPIGDERRLLNEFVLMVGPTGLGKGSSNHGPSRLFRRVEEYLALDLENQFQAGKSDGISQYPLLKIHTGGLSSGEGLAAALNDGEDDDKAEPVPDKRILIIEPEFSNTLSMSQRTGNIICMVLRNAYDGVDIKPLTKRDKVRVTNPYVCLMANITARELTGHDQSEMMVYNGMLNRFLILWQQPEKNVAFPQPIPDAILDTMAQSLADRLLFARQHNHETHYRKVREQAWPIQLSPEAQTLWEKEYDRLMNSGDCETVMILTRRHRLHALILATLFALLGQRRVIQVDDIHSALAWCEYSRKSVIYIFNQLREQNRAQFIHKVAQQVLLAIHRIQAQHGQCIRTQIYAWFHKNIQAEQLQAALEALLTHIPPLIEQSSIKPKRGKAVQSYGLTAAGRTFLHSNSSGGSL